MVIKSPLTDPDSSLPTVHGVTETLVITKASDIWLKEWRSKLTTTIVPTNTILGI